MHFLDFFKTTFGLLLVTAGRIASNAAGLPNVEPVMAASLPYAKRYGALLGAGFAFLGMVAYDFISGRLGLWTVYTGIAYAAVGYAAGSFLKGKAAGWKAFAGFGAAGTLFFDFTTALAFGWQFGQTLEVTLLGQVPFTLYHLAGNVAFCAVFSPLLYRHVFAAGAPLAFPAKG